MIWVYIGSYVLLMVVLIAPAIDPVWFKAVKIRKSMVARRAMNLAAKNKPVDVLGRMKK